MFENPNNDRIKIALIGYGSMGKEIEKQSDIKSFQITDIFDIFNIPDPYKEYEFDTAIDFSYPESVLDNIRFFSSMKKNIVVGTTGWYDRLNEAREIVEENGNALIYGSNYSLGMYAFMRILKFASQIFDNFKMYDVFLHEFHHKEKKDSPSGTALSLANIILNETESKKRICSEKATNKIERESLHVTSTRGGYIPGIHTVYFDSLADTIELKHSARNRSGFALGALLACKLIEGKKGVFEFNELLESSLPQSP